MEEKYETVKKQDLTEPSEEICEKCGQPMVFKHGRFGRFLACSVFPECKNAKKIPPVSLNIPCPKCREQDLPAEKQGEIVERRTKTGRIFFGCSKYPACDFSLWNKPTGEICPQCKGLLTFQAKGKVKCGNKECGYEKS